MAEDGKKARCMKNNRPPQDIKYTSGDDGSWGAETDLGKISKDDNGVLKGSFDEVRTISIGDITAIQNHQIDESEGAASHFIQFKNGGFCRITYRKTGEVIEFKVGKVKIHVSHEKVLTIYI
jgi:signal peptidase I